MAKNSIDPYDTLTAYLTEQDLIIKKDEFKCLLYAIRLLTLPDFTKEVVIKKASEKYTIPKNFIQKHLKAMGIKSQRQLKANREYGRKYAIEAYELKKAMEKES